MYKYVIFDFDGTVVDTGEGILKSLQFAFEDNGDKIPDLSDLRKFIGPPIFYSFKTFYNIPEDKIPAYIASYRKRYRAKGIYECALYDGMLDTIKKLKAAGVKIGIASSKPQTLIYDVANYLGITELFDAVSGTLMDDSNHATKVDLVNIALEKLGAADKSEAIMVGDRYFDIDGGNGAGIDSCGALWGYGNEEEFKQHNASYIIKHPSEVLELATRV